MLSAHDEGLAPERGIIELFDGCEKGIHVHMHYPALMRQGRPLVFHAQEAPRGLFVLDIAEGAI